MGTKIHSGLKLNTAVVGREGVWTFLQLYRGGVGRKGWRGRSRNRIEKGQTARKGLKIWLWKKEKTNAEEREEEYTYAVVKERNYQSFFCDSSSEVKLVRVFKSIIRKKRINILFLFLSGLKQDSDLLCSILCISSLIVWMRGIIFLISLQRMDMSVSVYSIFRWHAETYFRQTGWASSIPEMALKENQASALM